MNIVFEDYLFSKGYLVAQEDGVPENPAEALVALGRLFAIRVTAHPELADERMVHTASRNLGTKVPEPFYRGFPASVRELTPTALLLDQFISYVITYGFGDFSTPRHSLFEQAYERAAFAEEVEPKDFAILTYREARDVLARSVNRMLASTRQISETNYELVLKYLKEYGWDVKSCANKDTAARLIMDTCDYTYARLIDLPDVIRLVEWIAFAKYKQENIRKLNLSNRHRKLITQVIDWLFAHRSCDVRACMEKKRQWNGLLHHIHYRPKTPEACAFVAAVRGKTERSAYSEFEQLISERRIVDAAASLRASKGSGALMRNLVYLASRCSSDDDFACLVDSVGSTNKILLIQLLQRFSELFKMQYRTFSFVRFGRVRRHTEDRREAMRRKSGLTDAQSARIHDAINAQLVSVCQGTLGKVFADPDTKLIALPLREAASMGGYGTLPQGSRMKLPSDKVVRAFTYWEGVDDIDLSCLALAANGELEREFSWRTYGEWPPDSLCYSGDETSGFTGGSEYFDADVAECAHYFPGTRYLVFCNNVFTSDGSFDECTCKAGYMLRAEVDSGEIFEPKTVKTSFAVSAKGRFVYLFALDLERNEFIWLNSAEALDVRVAGAASHGFLLQLLRATEVINLYDFATMLATEVVDDPYEADVVFSDEDWELAEGVEWIRSCDTERITQLLNDDRNGAL